MLYCESQEEIVRRKVKFCNKFALRESLIRDVTAKYGVEICLVWNERFLDVYQPLSTNRDSIIKYYSVGTHSTHINITIARIFFGASRFKVKIAIRQQWKNTIKGIVSEYLPHINDTLRINGKKNGDFHSHNFHNFYYPFSPTFKRYLI